jgi:UDP-N-acetylglucosamine 1-carboxyvinyltransferase
MAACFAEGITTIRHAASEPHVQGLCKFLNHCGAKISGIGSNIITIEGITSLHFPENTSHRIGSDYLEVGSFISLAAVTGGELLIQDVHPDDIRMKRSYCSRRSKNGSRT